MILYYYHAIKEVLEMLEHWFLLGRRERVVVLVSIEYRQSSVSCSVLLSKY